jgi:hypothetical protein
MRLKKIPHAVLEKVQDRALFYPCSGGDLKLPIHTFSSYIRDFWFVDLCYFWPGHCHTADFGLDRPADEVSPYLADHPDYAFLDATIKGPVTGEIEDRWVLGRRRRDMTPCVRTEMYMHVPTGRYIRLHFRRGYGLSGFQKEKFRLGVFFYRGDSQGEGGSGNLWLVPKKIDLISSRLVNGGLIVTDGSNNGHNHHHDFLWNHGKYSDRGMEVPVLGDQFVDHVGRTFTCVGNLGYRYGPTLAWQVTKL